MCEFHRKHFFFRSRFFVHCHTEVLNIIDTNSYIDKFYFNYGLGKSMYSVFPWQISLFLQKTVNIFGYITFFFPSFPLPGLNYLKKVYNFKSYFIELILSIWKFLKNVRKIKNNRKMRRMFSFVLSVRVSHFFKRKMKLLSCFFPRTRVILKKARKKVPS